MNRPEQALQRTVVEYLRWALPDDCYWTAINPAPAKGVVMGRIAKSLGAKAGVPDLLLLYGGRVHFVELKAKLPRLSDVQKLTRDAIRSAGGFHFICTSLDELVMCLKIMEIPLKAGMA